MKSDEKGTKVMRTLCHGPLILGLVLLGWPQIGSAPGTWSVITLPQQPGEVLHPTAVVVDSAGNLYVAAEDPNARFHEGISNARVLQRDAQGNWSVIARTGNAPGQVESPARLAVDPEGNLYVA